MYAWEIVAVRVYASRLDSSPTSLATVFLDRVEVQQAMDSNELITRRRSCLVLPK